MEDELPRLAGQKLHRNLDGYWYAKVIEGAGRPGRYCDYDVVQLTHGDDRDRVAIQNPITPAFPGIKPRARRESRPHEDFLAEQLEREPFMYLEAFIQHGALDKMIHVVTDGGADRNTGPSGLAEREIYRDRETWRSCFEHRDGNQGSGGSFTCFTAEDACFGLDRLELPQGVSNKTLWQKLVEVCQQHSRIEWSWVKAHSGIVLSECADMSQLTE
jgi:hypothetical protein